MVSLTFVSGTALANCSGGLTDFDSLPNLACGTSSRKCHGVDYEQSDQGEVSSSCRGMTVPGSRIHSTWHSPLMIGSA